MWPLFLITVFVATAQAQLCLPCYGIICLGTCVDDSDGCSQCDGLILPGKRGACVIACDSGLYPELLLPICQIGYECKFNGCGQTCQKVEDEQIGLCAELCTSECPEGYACLSNGCGHSCQPVATAFNRP